MPPPNGLGLKWYTVKVETEGEDASTFMCEFLCLNSEEAERRSVQMVLLDGGKIKSTHVKLKYPEAGTVEVGAANVVQIPKDAKPKMTAEQARAIAAFVLVPVNVESRLYVQP